MMRGVRLAAMAALTVLTVFALVPDLTGPVAHEWLGMAAVVAVLAHCSARADWFAKTLRAAHRAGGGVARAGRLALNVLTFVSFAICVVSGVMMSGEIMLKLGLFAPNYYLWSPLHAASAKVLLALLVVHVALHARALVAMARRGRERAKGATPR